MDLSNISKPKTFSIPNIDKMVHLFFYTIMCFLWGMAVLKPTSSILLKITLPLVCILFGVGIEILQEFGGFNRSFEWQDILANTLGVFLGYVICLKILKFKPHNS